MRLCGISLGIGLTAFNRLARTEDRAPLSWK